MKTSSLIELFDAQAARTPQAIAVRHGHETVSYAELCARTSLLGRELVRADIGAGCVVGVCMERSIDLVAAILGIIRVGGCYLPIQPDTPALRVGYALRTSRVELVITDSPRSQLADVELFIPAKLPASDSSEHVPLAPAFASPDDLVYVMYTSGSTGQPKGVAMPHGALLNLIEWERERSKVPRRTLQFSPASFDVSFQEIFGTLSTGGELVMIDEDQRRDPNALLEAISRYQIQRLYLPFVALQSLAESASGTSLKLELLDVITAGEQLRITPAIRAMFGRLPNCRLHNDYGPTETHVVCSCTLVDEAKDWDELPPIGRALPNLTLHVCADDGAELQDDEIGELWIAGACLATGYHHRPELTKQRFLPRPGRCSGERFYRTGDLVRRRTNGVLEYLGRADSQVKIRGHRVELGEIEHAVLRCEGVANAAVVHHVDDVAGTRIAAYVVRGGPMSTHHDSISEWSAATLESLRRSLPEYMMPAALVVITALPLTSSGKVDRLELAQRTLVFGDTRGKAAANDMERQIAAIWEEVLRVGQVSVDVEFFTLGGDSLLATRVIAGIRERLDIQIPLRALFDQPTVRGLAAYASSARSHLTRVDPPVQGDSTLSG